MPSSSLIKLRVLSDKNINANSGRAGVEIYRPFFISGIICVLTVGCLLGAIALFGIGMNANYTLSSLTPYIMAHANSQLYGWVGLFIMGFAMQQHAPSISKAVLFHRLAWFALISMALGIALRFVAEPMVTINTQPWLTIGVVSCYLQILAVCAFIFNVGYTRHPTGPLTWQTKFVFASLVWWLIIVFIEPYFFMMSHQVQQEANTLFISHWFTPYREAQFLGFVTQMIFGVALIKFHTCFGTKEALKSIGNIGFYFWNAGLIMRIYGWHVFYQSNHEPIHRFLLHFGTLFMFIGGLLLILNTRVFEKVSEHLRSHKFLRAALFWFGVALLLMLIEPLHLYFIGAPFSHAYTGAIRHALTVGFISQMIIGVSLLMVARMNDLNIDVLPKLWSVFWLLNIGNTLRVGFEIATDYTTTAFLPMGFTGFIELIALAIWGFHIYSMIFVKKKVAYAT